MDLVGPLPESSAGNRYLLVITEFLTKWVEAAAIPDQSAATIANHFVRLIICTHGCPQKLLTDNGRNFTSQLLAELCRLTGCTKLFITPYHPAGNGLCERFNRTLVTMLSFFVDSHQRNWDTVLPYALFCYRASRQSSTKQSPFQLLFGREPRIPGDIFLGQPIPEDRDPTYAQDFQEKMRQAWELARTHIVKAQTVQKEQHDKRPTASAEDFNVGDRGYVRTPRPRKGLAPKLQRPYVGPQRIIRLTDTNAQVVMADTPRAKPQLVHLNRWKKARCQRIVPANEQETAAEEVEGADDQDTETITE